MYRQKSTGYQGVPQQQQPGGMPQGINFNFPGGIRAPGGPPVVKKDFS